MLNLTHLLIVYKFIIYIKLNIFMIIRFFIKFNLFLNF